MARSRTSSPSSGWKPTSRCLENRRSFVGGTYWWNHATVRALFASPAGPPIFCQNVDEAVNQACRAGGRVVAWAARLTPEHEARCSAHGLDLLRIEDGFIRSIGLGAGFAGAASLAVDARGIYYDPSRPSDLEHLLQSAHVSNEQSAEGARIRRRIVDLRLCKYNLRGRKTVQMNAGGRRVILVPGQVADDASVLKSSACTVDLHSPESINLQLLRQARARNRDAYLIYKPHPDVHFRLRRGVVPREEVHRYADLIVDNVDITELVERCDAVETISSLVGFEALLRNKPVTVHGVPFYAGWGVTTDLVRSPRRTARRTVNELCYVAFVRYTRHVNPLTRRACSIHQLLDALDVLRSSRLHQLRIAGLRSFARLFESVAAKAYPRGIDL